MTHRLRIRPSPLKPGRLRVINPRGLQGLIVYRNFSQRQVADHLGVHPATVTKWCAHTRPRPTISAAHAEKIAQLLDVACNDLFGSDESPPKGQDSHSGETAA